MTLKYYRGKWLLVKGLPQAPKVGQNDASQVRVQMFRNRRRAFESIGLDMRKYPRPEIKGMEHPCYYTDSMYMIPWLGKDDEIPVYRIYL